MGDPRTGTEYRLIRREGPEVVVAKFIYFHDGSGVVIADNCHKQFELDHTQWRREWDELQARGYVELAEAIRRNLLTLEELPDGWDSPILPSRQT